jgi:hypothetical protein
MEIFDSFKSVVQETFSPNVEEPSGETESTTGEKADFSPVFLTVNFENPIKEQKRTFAFVYKTKLFSKNFKRMLRRGRTLRYNDSDLFVKCIDSVQEVTSHGIPC